MYDLQISPACLYCDINGVLMGEYVTLLLFLINYVLKNKKIYHKHPAFIIATLLLNAWLSVYVAFIHSQQHF